MEWEPAFDGDMLFRSSHQEPKGEVVCTAASAVGSWEVIVPSSLLRFNFAVVASQVLKLHLPWLVNSESLKDETMDGLKPCPVEMLCFTCCNPTR